MSPNGKRGDVLHWSRGGWRVEERHLGNGVLQYIHILNHCFVHLKLLQCYKSIISNKTGKMSRR